MRLDLLRTKHRRRGQIFVDGGQKLDAQAGDALTVAPQLEVDPAQRRATVARDEASGLEAVLPIAPGLIEEDPDQRLGAGHEDAAALPRVAVIEPVGVDQFIGGAGRGSGGFGHRGLLARAKRMGYPS